MIFRLTVKCFNHLATQSHHTVSTDLVVSVAETVTSGFYGYQWLCIVFSGFGYLWLSMVISTWLCMVI